ncbi:hypothetical protein EM595_p0351 (plasmid) [Duffyella gerundensis]|uniref:Uncharacterized protein n=1 Tax=Duffyella gerundensis TaxID=1619313 RepID=A0A0U5LAD5_9GAMM|nr:hypothetical protein EM595_p0351 [Duffyella gerundensis]
MLCVGHRPNFSYEVIRLAASGSCDFGGLISAL